MRPFVVAIVILALLAFFFAPVLSAWSQGRAEMLKVALGWWGGMALLVALIWAKSLID